MKLVSKEYSRASRRGIPVLRPWKKMVRMCTESAMAMVTRIWITLMLALSRLKLEHAHEEGDGEEDGGEEQAHGQRRAPEGAQQAAQDQDDA